MHRSTCGAQKRAFMRSAYCFGVLRLAPVRRYALSSVAREKCAPERGWALRRNNAAMRQIQRLLTNVALSRSEHDAAHRHGVFLHNAPRRNNHVAPFFATLETWRRNARRHDARPGAPGVS